MIALLLSSVIVVEIVFVTLAASLLNFVVSFHVCLQHEVTVKCFHAQLTGEQFFLSRPASKKERAENKRKIQKEYFFSGFGPKPKCSGSDRIRIHTADFYET
jgi:hypothetical protein